MRHVILGTGVAGMAAIEAIRSVSGPADEIALIGDDPHGYYSRPGLAYYLTGEIPEKQLILRKQDDWHKLNVDYIKAIAEKIDPVEHQVNLNNGTRLIYDRLLLAVGARASKLKVPGADLEGVVKLDHLGDAQKILRLARRGKTAVIIGGGITALELVEGLVARGMKVHYLLRGERYWNNVLDEQEARIVEHRLRDEDVQIHFHSETAEILGKRGKVQRLRLLDGHTMRCDLVAYAIGIRPRVELARDAGLAIDRGVLVNEYLRTNDADIYAAGDVAQVYDPISKRSMIDSLWGPAREQGHTAGLNMAGNPTTYAKSAPFNVTRLAGLTTTIIGAVGHGRDDDLVGIARGDSETWRQSPDATVAQTGFEVNHLRLLIGEKKLIGAVVMGDQTLSQPLQKMIAGEVDISPIRSKLLAPNAALADILVEFWTNWHTSAPV